VPIDEKFHAVSHLKALTNGFPTTALQDYNSTLNLCYACLKIGILLHKKATVRFILITIVTCNFG
jgi:hypothetical protein